MRAPADSAHIVAPEARIVLGDEPTTPPAKTRRRDSEDRLDRASRTLAGLQRRLVADGRFAVLCLLQGMDASGKDGVIRAVFGRANPAACRVHAFGAPSREELRHDFLWRVWSRLPERGMIGVFNRSHYEEVVIVRVHPELLEAQGLPPAEDESGPWNERLAAIRAFERHLAASGTVVLKFFLHLSPQEQRRRFLRRLNKPDKHWKFASADVRERRHWPAYQRAYEVALRETSRPWAPWYAIPADDKPYARACVAEICAETIARLQPEFPAPAPEERRRMRDVRSALASGDEAGGS